jgi:hypothetical protein
MAINIPILTEFADAGLKTAQGAFDTFKSKVAEAEGGMGKFKAGAGVALDTVKANAGVFAAAAGGAIAGFALNAINDFQDLALEVDEFRNKTDLTLDQSSKWKGYSKDLGIEADTIVDIFKDLGTSAIEKKDLFDELGVAIALGEDGAVDIEETFFRVNDAINSLEDPVARGVYRNEIFGESWRNASELIQQGSDDIRTSLDGIKDFEIIDENEIEKAKNLRDAQEELGDAFREVSIKIGTVLIPALAGAAEFLAPIVSLIGDLDADTVKAASREGGLVKYTKAWESLNSPLKWLISPGGITMVVSDMMELDEVVDDNQLSTDELSDAWEEGTQAMIDAAGASEDLTEDLISVDDALAELKGNVDERQAWRNLINEIEDAGDAARKAFQETTPEALRASEQALDDARLKLGEYVAEMETIPEEKKTEIIASLDNANLAEVERILDNLARARQIPFMPSVRPGAGGINEIGSGGRPIGEAPIGFSYRPTVPSMTLNVQGSVVTEGDLLRSIRQGLANSQKSGNSLVYSNT